MKNLAVIPARSGSKGLKDKNIKLLNGKPLIAHTIEAAKKSGIFDEIMVSTDSEKYAEVARQWGANVPFLRSRELSNDTASSWDVVRDVVGKYMEKGINFYTVALLQPTSPLRTDQDIVDAYEKMKEKSANAVVTVSETDHSPLWTNTLPADHSMTNFINRDIITTPRQSLPMYYRINGAIYIVKTKHLINEKDIYSEKSYGVVIKKEHSIDIDNRLDFIIAEALIKEKISGE